MKLSVIIVSYNAAEFLRICLNSVVENLPADSEVIVFDNASSQMEVKAIPDYFPTVKFIWNSKNIGFSKANNQAVEQAQGDYILILNPDTVVNKDFFTEIIQFAENQLDMGAVGVRMIDGNGNFLPESKRNVPTLINSFFKLFLAGNSIAGSYYATHLQENQNGKVEVLTGACMLLKKAVFEEVGGFDESYFMYGEDIDLCYTLLQQGYSNYYLGNTSIIHFKGESTVKNEKYLDRFYSAMEIFISKYYKQQNPVQFYLMRAGLKTKYWWEKTKLRNS